MAVQQRPRPIQWMRSRPISLDRASSKTPRSWRRRTIRYGLRPRIGASAKASASEQIETGLAFYDEQKHAYHRYGHDPGVSALVKSAEAHWALAQAGRARCVVDETSSWRETTACPHVGTCPDLHLRSSNRALGHTGGEGSRVRTGGAERQTRPRSSLGQRPAVLWVGASSFR